MVRNGKENSVVAYLYAAIKLIRRNSNLVEFQFNILRTLRIIYFRILSTNVIRISISKSESRTKKRIDEKVSILLKVGKAIYGMLCAELRIRLDEKEMVHGALGMTRGVLRMACGG